MHAPIIITRPLDQATRFGADLRDILGNKVDIVFAPLQVIVPLDPLVHAQGFVFTSANGVAQAARLTPNRGPAWCVGDRTANMARNAGFDAISAGGTADDLIALITHDKPAMMLTHIRGEHAHGAISTRLTALGIVCDDTIAYRQQPRALPDNVKKMIEGVNPCVIPLFSPRSTGLLFEQTTPGPQAKLIAISHVAAKGADMMIADRPDGAAMLDATVRAYRALAVT